MELYLIIIKLKIVHVILKNAFHLTGYYLENDIYKKCFYTCKECEKKGDNKTHYCLKCNDNFPIEKKRIITQIVMKFVVIIIILMMKIITIALLIQLVQKNIRIYF